MKAETGALLQQCRSALLRQSDECIAALLTQWFEFMIGEESIDEEIDDLCLLLDYPCSVLGCADILRHLYILVGS